MGDKKEVVIALEKVYDYASKQTSAIWRVVQTLLYDVIKLVKDEESRIQNRSKQK